MSVLSHRAAQPSSLRSHSMLTDYAGMLSSNHATCQDAACCSVESIWCPGSQILWNDTTRFNVAALHCQLHDVPQAGELVSVASLSSTSFSRYSFISPAASRMLCQTSQPLHCANTRPLFQATGLIMRCVVAPAHSATQHELSVSI